MLGLALGLAQAEELALEQALAEAVAANPELEGSRLSLARTEAQRLGATGAYDPVLSASADVGASTTPTNSEVAGTADLVARSSGWSAGLAQHLPTGATATLAWSETYATSNSADVILGSTVADRATLSVTQPLLSGVGPGFGLRSARLAVDDASLALREATEDLVIDVSSGYWRLVSAKRSYALAVRSREIAEQSLADARERHDEGFAGSGDVLQVERAAGVARQAEVVAAAEVEAADVALRRLLGRPIGPGATIEPVDTPQVPEVLPVHDEVQALARAGNAAWLRQQLAFASAGLSVREQRLGALPDLSVTGVVGASGLAESPDDARGVLLSGDYVDWGLGASVSVPIPGRVLVAARDAARVDEDLARVRLQAAEQDLAVQAVAAVQRVERDRSRVVLAAETVRAARLALEADQQLVEDGRASPRDLVISLESLDQAQAEELSAQIDLQVSLLEVRRVAGTLLE